MSAHTGLSDNCDVGQPLYTFCYTIDTEVGTSLIGEI